MKSISVSVLLSPRSWVSPPRLRRSPTRKRVQRIFGTIEDPDKDCRFTLVKDKLELTMKGGKQYDYFEKLKNCPRAVKGSEGGLRGDGAGLRRPAGESPGRERANGGGGGRPDRPRREGQRLPNGHARLPRQGTEPDAGHARRSRRGGLSAQAARREVIRAIHPQGRLSCHVGQQ